MERSTKIADLTYELMHGLSKHLVNPLFYTSVSEDGSVETSNTPFGEKLEQEIIKQLDKNL